MLLELCLVWSTLFCSLVRVLILSNTGGGNRVARGLMGSKMVEDHSKVQQELDGFEKRIKKLTDNLNEVKATRTKLENEINTLTARISELEIAIPKMEMDVKVWLLINIKLISWFLTFCSECDPKTKRNQSWITCIGAATKGFRKCDQAHQRNYRYHCGGPTRAQ